MVKQDLILSMSEPTNRTIYAKKGDSGRLYDIFIADAEKENGTLRILQPDGSEVTAPAIIQASGDDYKGDLVTFDALEEVPLTKCEVTLESSQDLHGYANPWPSGGGKNKLHFDDASGTINGTTRTIVDDTMTISGTPSATASFSFSALATVLANYSTNMVLSFTQALPSGVRLYGRRTKIADGTQNYPTYISGSQGNTSYLFELGIYTYDNFYLEVATSFNGTAHSWKYQLEIGSSPTAYAPYSNICPISGWDEVTVYDDAKYGGTIKWNQMLDNFTSSTTGNSFPFKNGESVTQGDKLLVHVKRSSAQSRTRIELYSNKSGSSTNIGVLFDLSASGVLESWEIVTVSADGIANGTSSGSPNMWLYRNGYTPADTVSLLNIFNLTEMFGEGNEPTVEEFRALFPKDYYAYNSGTEMTVGEVNGEPYRKIPLSLGQNVYGGTLDVVSGKLTVTHQCVTLDSSLDSKWYRSSSYQGGYYVSWTNINSIYGTSFGSIPNGYAIKCSHAKTVSSLSDYLNGTCYAEVGNLDIRIMSESSTLAEWKQYIADQVTAGTPIQIWAKVGTPIEVDLTPTQISTLLGENNVWSSGEVEVAFEYDGLFAQLPEEATEQVGKCIGDVAFTGASSMPFILHILDDVQEETP